MKKEVNREVKRAIKKARLKYKNNVKQTFTQGDFHSAWQGIKNMASVNSVSTSRKSIQIIGSSSMSPPNDLNSFFLSFKNNPVRNINTEEVVRILRKTTVNRALVNTGGPSGNVLSS